MSETKFKASFKYLLFSGGAIGSLNTLAFGPFMVAYALLLGAGSLSVSFLNSLGNIGSLLSLFAIPLLQKNIFPKKPSFYWLVFRHRFICSVPASVLCNLIK